MYKYLGCLELTRWKGILYELLVYKLITYLRLKDSKCKIDEDINDLDWPIVLVHPLKHRYSSKDSNPKSLEIKIDGGVL